MCAGNRFVVATRLTTHCGIGPGMSGRGAATGWTRTTALAYLRPIRGDLSRDLFVSCDSSDSRTSTSVGTLQRGGIRRLKLTAGPGDLLRWRARDEAHATTNQHQRGGGVEVRSLRSGRQCGGWLGEGEMCGGVGWGGCGGRVPGRNARATVVCGGRGAGLRLCVGDGAAGATCPLSTAFAGCRQNDVGQILSHLTRGRTARLTNPTQTNTKSRGSGFVLRRRLAIL